MNLLEESLQCLDIQKALLQMEIGYGNSVTKGIVPWLISPQPFYFKQKEIETIEAIGRAVLGLYRASPRIYLREKWVRELLDKGKPRSVLRYQEQALSKGKLPRIFRVDLIMTPDRKFKVVELSIKPGGSTITGGAQLIYGKHFPTIAGLGILPAYQMLLDESNRVGRLLVPKEKWKKHSELNALALYLRKMGYEVEAQSPEGCNIPQGCFVYSYLPPRTWPTYLPEIDYQAAGIWTPPLYIFLKEKALLALLGNRKFAKQLSRLEGSETLRVLEEHVIPTFIVRKDQPPVIERCRVPWSAIAKKFRNTFIKVSGFSENASGALGAIYGLDVSASRWKRTVDQALNAFSTGVGLYVFQPAVESTKVPVRYADPKTWEMKEELRRLRILAFFFVFEGEAVLAGIEVNSRSRVKVHMQKDATSVPGAISENDRR